MDRKRRRMKQKKEMNAKQDGTGRGNKKVSISHKVKKGCCNIIIRMVVSAAREWASK